MNQIVDISKSNKAQSTILQSTWRFASGTLLSRFSGLIRDMSMAYCFGTTSEIAAFLVAFRLANLLRRIFGEGALLNGFIPHFEACRNKSPKHAAQFFCDLFFSIILILFVIITGAELGLYSYLKYGNVTQANQQIYWLTMIMLPGVLFICLFSMCSGLLQCENYFFLTGFAPVAFNAIWIANVWFFRNYSPGHAVIALSLSITLAFFFQWSLTMPKTVSFIRSHLSWKEICNYRLFSPELRQMLNAISLGVIGVSAMQINSAIDTIFARYASLEGPAYLNYAIHLQQLPLALFGVGVSSVLLPPLSRAMQSQNALSYAEHLSKAISLTLILLFPCTMGIFVLGGASINLLYGRGDFTQASTLHTTQCLWGYGVGLIPMGMALILSTAFYAKKDYRTPTHASLISICVNLFLNCLFVFFLHYGPASLALSTSMAACVNAGILLQKLLKAESYRLFPPFISTLKLILVTSLAGGATLGIEYLYFNNMTLQILFQPHNMPYSLQVSLQLIHFLVLLLTYGVTFLTLAWLLQIKAIFALLKRK